MSDTDSEARAEEEDKGPQNAGEVIKEIFVRILAGLAVSELLGHANSPTGNCVKGTVYPMKEACIRKCDQVNSYLHPTTTRSGGPVPEEGVVHFSPMVESFEES